MIFARRALQRRLDELRVTCSENVVAAWAARLNKAGRDRLAAMWEVVVVHALTRQGEVTIETTLPSGRRPDVTFAGPVAFVADITTVSDEGLDEANPFADLLREIERAKGRLGLPVGGVDLSVYSKEITGNRGRKRVLRLPPRKRLRELVDEIVGPALKAQIQQGERVMRVVVDNATAGFTLTVDPARAPYSGGSYAAYAAPTIRDDNPLYRALRSKARQLRGAEGRVGVIVGDGSTDALLGGARGPSTLTPRAICQEFLRQHQSISFVLILTLHEQARPTWTAATPERRVEPVLVARDGDPSTSSLEAVFRAAVAAMPRPVNSPVNGALRARETGYDLGHHGGYQMSHSKIRISAREMLEVLAGQRTLADEGARNVGAGRASGRTNSPGLEKAFGQRLREGRLPVDIRIVRGGEDDNDDWVEFDFAAPDPAISPLR